MMKNTGYILALCLAASGQTLAHDVWITGKQAENNVTAEIGYGIISPQRARFLTEGISLKLPDFITGKRQ